MSPDAIYNRARYLKGGRYLQRDPLGYVDGMSVYANFGALKDSLDPSGTSPTSGSISNKTGPGLIGWLEKEPTGLRDSQPSFNFFVRTQGHGAFDYAQSNHIVSQVEFENGDIVKSDRRIIIDYIGHGRSESLDQQAILGQGRDENVCIFTQWRYIRIHRLASVSNPPPAFAEVTGPLGNTYMGGTGLEGLTYGPDSVVPELLPAGKIEANAKPSPGTIPNQGVGVVDGNYHYAPLDYRYEYKFISNEGPCCGYSKPKDSLLKYEETISLSGDISGWYRGFVSK